MLCGLGMGVPTTSKAEVHKDRGESPLEDSATVEVVGRVLKAKSSWRSRNEMKSAERPSKKVFHLPTTPLPLCPFLPSHRVHLALSRNRLQGHSEDEGMGMHTRSVSLRPCQEAGTWYSPS